MMLIIWTLILLYEVSSGLRIIKLDIPENVRLAGEVTLSCMYDLEEDNLYSVKWYKDDLEFFRYVPKELPQRQFFPLDGINIDFTRSNKDVVFIQDVQMSTGGRYRCEVSADAPSFRTVSTEKAMKVSVETGRAVRGQHNLKTVTVLFLVTTVFRRRLEHSLHC
ncbi:uncharacterized protein LOC143233293 [Tachypleus tridentatus]|uniref:uncharacterized protein LOC143233293 n=1 Tax=Tachypleus tridentatus TaxID=6853 RepID=UPI003FD3B66C